MTKKGIYKVLVLVSVSLISTIMPAQEFPNLPSDPDIRTEKFPNGMTCYVAANPHVKGFADYAVVRRSDHREVLRLSNYMTTDQVFTDSTLLSLVKTVAGSGQPGDHAVFACGDLDASSVLDKIRYMSFMVPSGDVVQVPQYFDGELSKVSLKEIPDSLSGISVIMAEWTSPRTPEAYMNTIQKAIYDKTIYELGYIVRERVRDRLLSMGIYADDVVMNHRSSLDGTGEEYFRFSIKAKQEDACRVKDVLKEELGSIDSYGASLSELDLAEYAYLSELSEKAAFVSNKDYMEMCISAYLYNSSLTTPAGLIAFHKSKDVPDELKRSVFASISSALIDIEPGEYPRREERFLNLVDTLALPSQSSRTVLRSFKKDPLSGGVVWTFLNGFKVVYKHMPTDGVTYYSLAVNGGYGSIRNYAHDGEKYLSDYLDSCYISGMKPDYFADLLKLTGLTMDAKLNFSNVIISGEVHDDNIGLLMKALLAVANERSATDALLDDVAAQMNDGVLVVVSDMEESVLRKQLASYVGGFRTKERALRRVNVSGHHRRIHHSDDISEDGGNATIELSTYIPLTLENCAAADIAALILENSLINELSDLELDINVSHALRIYPKERYTIRLTASRKDGCAINRDLLQDVYAGISRVLDSDIDPDHFAAAKIFVKHRKTMEMKDPSYWLHAIAMRYLDGKDHTSGYEDMVDNLEMSAVTTLFSLLND